MKAIGELARPQTTLHQVRGVMLDLDGVLFKGEDALPGAGAFLDFLRLSGRRCVAVTNHSGRTAREVAAKLERLNLPFPEEDILTSGWATARLLSGLHPKAGVYVLGSDALRRELAAVNLHPSSTPAFVVVGYDPWLRLETLTEATWHLLAGAQLVGTNPDALLPGERGPEPECGPILAYLERASGQQALVCGKPARGIVDAALERLGVARGDALIVGDTVETDIQAGVSAGVRTALVLTGNARDAHPAATVTVPDLDALQARLG